MGLHWDEFNDSGIKCPYCGCVHEVCETVHDGPWDCESCEQQFDVEVEYSATYYTTKLETELEYQQTQHEYWLAPKDEHKEHAESIAKDYAWRIKQLKERMEQVKERLAATN